MMIDSNVIRLDPNTDDSTGNDLYTTVLKTSSSIRGMLKKVANRGFMKAVLMKWGYSSTPNQVAYLVSTDMTDPNSL